MNLAGVCAETKNYNVLRRISDEYGDEIRKLFGLSDMYEQKDGKWVPMIPTVGVGSSRVVGCDHIAAACHVWPEVSEHVFQAEVYGRMWAVRVKAFLLPEG